MVVLIGPNGQNVDTPKGTVSDRIRKGYRIPAAVSTPPAGVLRAASKKVTPAATEGKDPKPLDLATADLSEIVKLPTITTAAGRKIKTLAGAGNLSLDTLQAQIKNIDWVDMYEQGLATWPGGLTAATEEEAPESNDKPEA